MSFLVNDRMRICVMRFEGKSISQIGKAFGVTKQTILNFLKSLPHSERETIIRPDFTTELVTDICSDYFQGMKFPALAEKYAIPEADIADLFSYFSARKLSSSRTKYYPALAKWMRQHSYSNALMAKELDIPVYKFCNIVGGYEHMRYDLAERICGMTGLTMSELFSKVFKPSTSNLPVKKTVSVEEPV